MKIPPELNQIIKDANHITVLTGAGISAESGIPTFREAQTGLWAKYDPEELATPQAFRKNPELVWRWYHWRQEIVSKAKPNPGHYALSQMEAMVTHYGSRFTLITQNIDGLHQRAGSQNIIELHGSINRSKCFVCGIFPDGDPDRHDETPHCVYCGGWLRPDVVWFGENLSTDILQSAWDAAQNCDLFLSIGTSTVVQPAASLPIVALQKGTVVVELNPSDTPISALATFSLQDPSGEILPLLIKTIWPELEKEYPVRNEHNTKYPKPTDPTNR